MESVLGLVRHPGNDALFRAMEMSLLAAVAGHPVHLHAEGLRGTGKTTAMRAVRRALPRIRRIRGCLYNCDPERPHCPLHRSLPPEEVAALGEERVPMPFLEISHSAKVGTVVGSIDLGRLVSPTRPEAALLPGTIPQAHRGIIFVDEINRLAETSPELADVLLDVMGTKPGRVQIEETGLPAVALPVQVSVWAASNPDEDPGPLEEVRRQLSDRFDMVIYTDRPGDPEVVERILAAPGDGGWQQSLSPADEAEAELFRARLAGRVAALEQVAVPPDLRRQVADLYSRFNVESLRAVQAIHLGMRLAACLESRAEAALEDLVRVAPLALRHRVDTETLRRVTAHLAGEGPRREGPAVAAGVRMRFPSVHFGGVVAEGQSAQAGAAGGGPAASGTEARGADGSGAPGGGPCVQPGRPAPGEPTGGAGGSGGAQARRSADGSARPATAEGTWPTRYPPRPRQDEQTRSEHDGGSGGWLARAVAGLRRNLGLAPISGTGQTDGSPGSDRAPATGGHRSGVSGRPGALAGNGLRPAGPGARESDAHGRAAPGPGALYRRPAMPGGQLPGGARQDVNGITAAERPGTRGTGSGDRPAEPAGAAGLPNGVGGEAGTPGAGAAPGSRDAGEQARRGAGGVHRPDPLRTPHEAPPNPARPLTLLQPHEFVRTEEELGRR